MKNKVGRPPIDPASRSVGLCLKLCTRDYDRLYHLASKRRESMQEVLRQGLARVLSDAGATTDKGET
jgi:hypothetical protein